jgi:hypothetical protein
VRKEKKFLISWINDPHVEHDYFEIWGEKQLLSDFNNDIKMFKLVKSTKIGGSFIYFDCDNYMMVITRVPNAVSITI